MGHIRTDVGKPVQKVPMVKIIWKKKAESLLNAYIDNAIIEYGKTTALKWAEEIANFENRIRSFPDSYPPEELLQGRTILHRRCHIMNRRFKIIYHYDESENVAHVDDIWDTKRNPSALIHRIK